MNFIYLKGIVKNIEYSHSIGDTIFNKANLIVKRPNGQEDLIILKFKQFSQNFKENSEIELIGNIRTFSKQMSGKNKVEVYVFSYFDVVDEEFSDNNVAKVTGKICKKDLLRHTTTGKHYIHYIVANNLITEGGQKLNSYIPCVAWGKEAKNIDTNYVVGDSISLSGQLHSREYTKTLDNGEIEFRVANELATLSITKGDN